MTNRVISVASSKGGIGKSTAALGLSRALAGAGHKVLLADLDFGNACLDILCGVEDEVLYTVSDLVSGRCEAASAAVKMKEDNLYLLPAPAGGKEDCPDALGLTDAVRRASEAVGADYTVLDTGAGVNAAADAVFGISHTVLVVAGHSPVSLRAAESTAARIASLSHASVKLLINSFDTANILKGRGRSRSGMLEIIDRSGIPLIGVIPYDYRLQISSENPETKYSEEIVTAFENVAARLCGESVPLFSGMRRIRKKKKILFS